ncbi:hypothetical protein Tco_1243878 [Tanacetum coccineum]
MAVGVEVMTVGRGGLGTAQSIGFPEVPNVLDQEGSSDNEVEEVFNETTQFIASSSKQDGGGWFVVQMMAVGLVKLHVVSIDIVLYESYKDACDLTKEHMEFCKVFDINPRKQIK